MGNENNFCHSGIVRTKPYDVDAALMLYERHERGIHALSVKPHGATRSQTGTMAGIGSHENVLGTQE
jgi:hypothetical protein